MARKRADLTAHAFGGPWTQQKLALLSKYLSAYTRILGKSPFNFAYIDAFAGTGSRGATADSDQPDMFDAEAIQFAEGSARIALACDLPFQKYIFIDNDRAKLDQLATVVRKDFPAREDCVTYCHGDANVELRRLCRMNWSAHRALLFLDPYGLQVEWETVIAIARTKGIDLWVLFPIGVAVNRMLTRSGSILPSWRQRLTELFGTEEWETEFYGPRRMAQLFEGEEQREKIATLTSIVEYYQARLRSIFAGVADSPALLRNSKGNPLYALCFAVANEKGSKPALKIANHILGKFRNG